MLGATIEMNAFKSAYQSQVLSNARAFAKACAAHGIPVEGGEAEGYTRTHQVIIRVTSFGDAKEIASRLERNNIITNYQALPATRRLSSKRNSDGSAGNDEIGHEGARF